MKLNQATDYGFRMVLFMSIKPAGEKFTGKELAKALNIPDRFLLKIMRSLTKSGIMRSYRGVEGGFALAKDPSEVSIFDVIEAVEGSAYLQKCLYDPESCSRGCNGICSVREAFVGINAVLIEQFKEHTFDKLAKREVEFREI